MATNFSNESSSLQNITCNFRNNSFPVKIVKIVLYSLILLSSLVWNTLLIKVVHKRKELGNTINYFIVNMAVSDFVYPLTHIPVQLTQIAASSWEWRITGTAGPVFKISRLCYRLHLGRGDGRRLFNFVFYWLDTRKRRNCLQVYRKNCINVLVGAMVAITILYCAIVTMWLSFFKNRTSTAVD